MTSSLVQSTTYLILRSAQGARHLRVCVVMAHCLPIPPESGAVYGEIRERCAEMQRLGRAAWDTLHTIPDTPALVAADRAFIAAHPLPLDRSPHPLGADMAQVWQRLSAYLDRSARIN
jgi:hypothetical protein